MVATSDWYDHDASWRPFIPLKPDSSYGGVLSESGQDWFFDLDMSTPWVQGSSGGFTIPEHACSTIDSDLTNWSWYIDKIASNHPFPFDAPCPQPYDHGITCRGFYSSEELQAAGGVVKRTAVDYLGFLTWWTSSISRWEADLDVQVATQIKDLQLHRFHKRGVLVDLEQHWQEINISNLLRNGVPVAYPWPPSLSMIPHFSSLAPRILQAYDKRQLSMGGEVRSTDFNDWTDEFAAIQRYDQFFQEISDGGRPDPDVQFNDEWEYYVVDFQGWSRRCIPLSVAWEYYVLFASTVDREGYTTITLFRCWEPLDNFVDGLPRLVGPTSDSDDHNNFVRGACEIWEMHKFKHAPVLNKQFDSDGCPMSPPTSSGGSLRPAHGARGRVRDDIPPAAGRWLQLMTSDDGQRTGSRRSGSGSTSASQSHPASCISFTNRGHEQSASPQSQTYQQCRTGSPSARSTSRQHAIARLEEECSMITYQGAIWTMPPDLEWNASFYRDSILLFPDSRTLTRLRYWAVCDLSILNMQHLLELAMSRNMKFTMATRISDLKTFKPVATPELSELTKHTYEIGFQEEHLKDINGGAVFCDQYMGKLADILRCPQARALIGMGGPTAWIAKWYGGPSIV